MTQILDACVRILDGGRGMKPISAPEKSAIGKVAAALGNAGIGGEKPRPGKDYDAIAGQIRNKVREGISLGPKEVRDSAWCLWKTNPSLASEKQALTALIPMWEASDRRRCFRALAASYVESYSPNLPGIETVAASLVRQSQRWGAPWDRLQRELAIFQVVAGPRALGRAAVKADVTVADILTDYGCSAVGAKSGLAQAAADEVLIALSEDRSGDHEGRLRRVQRFALQADNRFLFAPQAPLVARALLNPFLGQAPDKTTRDLFLRVVLALYGDPRIKPGAWNHFRDIEEMVRQWLTEQSLRQFLDIVDQTAVEHMWKYRRAFWEAVQNAGLISEAWVVFADQGARLARSKFGKDASFGRFDDSGTKQVEPGHAVLLLRIGRGIVADWSHNGKCNIWADAEAKNAPRLYKPSTYNSDETRIGQSSGNLDTKDHFSVLHAASDRYAWQARVAERLQRMTGVRIPQSSYIVR